MRSRIPLLATLGLAVALTSCATIGTHSKHQHLDGVELRPTGRVLKGKASWYATYTQGGSHTASGERLRNDANTAAHKSLPHGTYVNVTNLQNGRSQIVRITDRGPFTRGRIIDVTIGVAKRLDFVNAGVVPVHCEIMERVADD